MSYEDRCSSLGEYARGFRPLDKFNIGRARIIQPGLCVLPWRNLVLERGGKLSEYESNGELYWNLPEGWSSGSTVVRWGSVPRLTGKLVDECRCSVTDTKETREGIIRVNWRCSTERQIRCSVAAVMNSP